MPEEKKNLSSKDSPTTTTPGTDSRPGSGAGATSLPHPEYREWAARNAELNFVEMLHEGLEELFPGIWRRYIPLKLIEWLHMVLYSTDEMWPYAWEELEPLRRSIVKFTIKTHGKTPFKEETPEFTDWMIRMLYRSLDLYFDIMRDPNNATDDLSVLS